MKTIKNIAIIALSLFILLIALFARIQNPLEKQYDETVLVLMKNQGYASEQEVLENHSELIQIKVQIEQINSWNYRIQQAKSNPIPLGESQSNELLQTIESVAQWKEAIRHQLDQVIREQSRETAQL